MTERFLHFDAHFHNILAHNNHPYFADFGLSISEKFDLSAEERAFFNKHRDYDSHFVIAELAQRLIVAATGEEAAADDYLSDQHRVMELAPAVASIAERYRPIAMLMGNFFQALRESKNTPYPASDLAQTSN